MPRSKTPKQPHPLAEPEIGPSGQVEITLDQAPIEARLRYENAEKWIAWAPDGKSIIAADKDYDVVRAAAVAAGFPRALCEWVPPVTGAIWE
jgi:hypothetical protein